MSLREDEDLDAPLIMKCDSSTCELKFPKVEVMVGFKCNEDKPIIEESKGRIDQLRQSKGLYDEMSGGFFDLDGELDIAGSERSQNYFSRVKTTITKIASLLALVWILVSYLDILGTEKSQEVKYISSLSLSYNSSLIPKLLPMH